jgi:probable HAF family extracellular repeat protein
MKRFLFAGLLAAASPMDAEPSLTALPLPPGAFSANGYAVSADGSSVAGMSLGNGHQAFRWTAAGGIQPLGTLIGPGGASEAFGISSDGSVVVGVSSSAFPQPGGFLDLNRAFRWTEVGMVSLGDLPGGSVYGWANAVSDDGAVIAGNSESAAGLEGFRWTEEEGMIGLGLPPGWASASAYGLSADGSTIVGGLQKSGGGFGAFFWTEETGMVGIGGLQPDGSGGFARDARPTDP